MRFIKILTYDLKNGFKKNAWKQSLIFGLVIVYCISFCFRTRDYIMFHEVNSWKELSISSSDVVLYCFGGMLRFIPENATAFHLPVMWLLFTTGICYLTLQYPYGDISHTGIQVIIRSGGKVRWWFSKCVWSALTIISYFVASHLAILVFCTIVGIPISLNVDTSFSQGVYGLVDFGAPDLKSLFFFIYILPLIVCAAISILQMILSLIIKPFIAFFCICVFWISNVYFYSPYLIGNYAIPLRANIFGNGDLKYPAGTVICLLFYALFIGIGAVVIKSKELLYVEK